MRKTASEEKMHNGIESYLTGRKRIAIAGHISPDGDCVGSCLGLWNYLQDNYPEIQADVYMQSFPASFGFLRGADRVLTELKKDGAESYDMLVSLDISSPDRIGAAGALFGKTETVLCIDHHRTNTGSYTYFINDSAASSASEVLYRLLDPDKISKECAEALYTGIAHDTGVFRYTCTSPETMRVAAALMEKGIAYSDILDETYYQKSYAQKKIQGHVIDNSRLYFDGLCIVGTVTAKERHEAGLKSSDLDGIVSALRDTIGVDVSMLLSELDDGSIKASMRSKAVVDVSEICLKFGGGGHVRAAGFRADGKMEETIEAVLPLVQAQLEQAAEAETAPAWPDADKENG